MINLSVIITFANEKDEVEKTIISVRRHSPSNLPIILVNDASDDDFNYDILEERYNLCYIKNKRRMGVAKSRELGVKVCLSTHFILLDAHMRFFSSSWYEKIINIFKLRSNVLLCCQTYDIGNCSNLNRIKPTGAKIVFFDNCNTFNVVWNFMEKFPLQGIESIPCVLGASYAMSKDYWTYLKGLEGLIGYGGDEPYLSIKVWLQGGECMLMKDIVIGHLYRKEYPYMFNDVNILCNKMLIIYLLVPTKLKGQFMTCLKWEYGQFHEVYAKAFKMIVENTSQNEILRKYYKSIFKNDFDYFVDVNRSYFENDNGFFNDQINIDRIVIELMADINSNNTIGLFNGLMGKILFFMHYSEYKSEEKYAELAFELLSVINNSIDMNTPIGFANGLCGIGWGIEYLLQNELMGGDSENILSDLDAQILNLSLENISDYNIDDLIGILYYLHARINRKEYSILVEHYIERIRKVLYDIILKEKLYSGVNIAIELLDHLDQKRDHIIPISLEDIFFFYWRKKISNKDFPLLEIIGQGIKFMTIVK